MIYTELPLIFVRQDDKKFFKKTKKMRAEQNEGTTSRTNKKN